MFDHAQGKRVNASVVVFDIKFNKTKMLFFLIVQTLDEVKKC